MAEYTRDEVAKHNKIEDCWIIMEDNVYDVTEFLSKHPAGEEVIIEVSGQDATDAFEKSGHSKRAFKLADKYCIGKIKD